MPRAAVGPAETREAIGRQMNAGTITIGKLAVATGAKVETIR